MRKLFTFISFVLLSASLFAATEQAWYNDVTSIANNGQYYIYSVNGKGFMQGGNSKVKAVTQNNYNSESNLLFTISTSNKRTYSGSNYLCSYETQTCGPVGGTNTGGSTIIWEGKSSYWLVYGSYSFIWTQKAYLRYESNAYEATCLNPSLNDSKFHWYLVSPAQYDRHWAIYLYDRYKESISDYTKWENLVPAAYYTALSDAYAVTYNVQNAEHSKEVVNAHRADLKALYNNAEAVANAYANAKAAIDALEAVEDKGEDFADVTAGITAARSAIEEAMSVDALNAAVSAPALKAIDPITFSVTEFTAINPVEGAAASVAGRAITYEAVDKNIINNGKALYKGNTTLTATAAATSEYYKFVRSAQVTVDAPTTYGDFEETSCDEPVEYNGKTYSETTKEDVNVGLNYMGGDSVVHVAITINHATFGTEEMAITVGDDMEWNGIALKDSTVGAHSVVAVLTNAASCDSTVTLTLTVNKMDTLNVPVDLKFCAGDSAEFRGKWYFSAEDSEEISAEGATRDTLFVVNVTVLQPSFGNAEMEITVGDEVEWNGIALKDSTVGVHTVVYTTTNAVGCDSIVTLTLTVNKLAPVEVNYPIGFCTGDSAEYRGKWYYQSGEDKILVEDAICDTVINVTIAVLPVDFVELNTDSLHIGDTLFLGDGLWYLVGDEPELLTDTAYVMEVELQFDITMTATNEFGCDSVIVRHVVVETKPVDPETPTAIDQYEQAAPAVKELRNGVLYIRRNDALYTTEGCRVE